MAARKKVPSVDPFEEVQQRLSKLEEHLQDLDDGVGHDLGIHDQLIEDLQEDLVGRDKVIWAILDQHNARIAALKFAFNPLPPDEVAPEGEVILANGYEDSGNFPGWALIALWVLVMAGFLTYCFLMYRAYLGL
jgi:hypothetical protein